MSAVTNTLNNRHFRSATYVVMIVGLPFWVWCIDRPRQGHYVWLCWLSHG